MHSTWEVGEPTRLRKAAKIITILQEELGQELSGQTCLDTGCAIGIITDELARHFGRTLGVDVDTTLVRQAGKHSVNGALFSVSSGARLPFPNAAFDVVVCAQVYEHVTDQRGLASEIHRVLRPGGVCFFSGPNRLKVIEEHYWLPFLSWLPQPVSDFYMRLLKKGPVYDVWPLFYWQLRRLWGAFEVRDYTVRMLRDPHRYAVDDRLSRAPWIAALPDWVWWAMQPVLPNYNWILIKPKLPPAHLPD